MERTTKKVKNEWLYSYKNNFLNIVLFYLGTVKTIWNMTAKMLMDQYFEKYHRKINPFEDISYKKAREAKNTKRKELQQKAEKRKSSSDSLPFQDFKKIVDTFDEDTADGLIKKVFLVFSFELAWRGGEAVKCLVNYFKIEKDTFGNFTNRIEYNPIFAKTAQGGDKKCSESKWLVSNKVDLNICPVRLYHKYMDKRQNVESPRFFVSVNLTGKTWYKNTPVGKNTISTWTKLSAQRAGIDTKNKKITNHSLRASAVSALAKSGVNEEQLIKITGHASTSSIRPYLQLDQEHHQKIFKKMRGDDEEANNTIEISSEQAKNQKFANKTPRMSGPINAHDSATIYTNCTFNCNTLYCSK